MRARAAVVIVVSLVFAAISAGIAQNPDGGTGQITGTVRDSGGNTMPGVRVEVTSPALTGPTPADKVRSMWTDANGQYRFAALPVGTYKVSFSLNGFNTYEQNKVVITRGFTARVNATMVVGRSPGATVPLPPSPPADANPPRRIGGVLGSGNGTGVGSGVGGGIGGGVPGGVPGGVIGGGVPGGVPGGVIGGLASPPPFDTERYDSVQENGLRRVTSDPLSTFSIDVDTASYANVRRFLTDGRMPPAGAVRVEELINYFHFDYPQPSKGEPFSITTELSECPWNPSHRLALIGIQGRRLDERAPAPRNLVFLLDVSGSMAPADKLPLIRNAMRMLVDVLTPADRVAIVVYAGASGLVLPSTSGNEKDAIHRAIARLEAGGSTNGGAGIRLAYQVARQNFIRNGVNRVILATDGDFNVGVTSQDELVRLIEEERASGVFLSVLGVGTGNLNDSNMEKLADKGNGNYAYLDSLHEARRVLVREAGATLETIAKDVKIQVEFNPKAVNAYRLIGYENRVLRAEDFNNDKKDAGEIGAGHSVTALYEIIPAGVEVDAPGVDPLKYQQAVRPTRAADSAELATVKVRYKQPDGDTSSLITTVLRDRPQAMTANIGFGSAVAEFGMLLRNSEYRAGSSFSALIARAQKFRGSDPEGYRGEFVRLADLASGLYKLDDQNRELTRR